jgi:hypothetical protein
VRLAEVHEVLETGCYHWIARLERRHRYRVSTTVAALGLRELLLAFARHSEIVERLHEAGMETAEAVFLRGEGGAQQSLGGFEVAGARGVLCRNE